MKKIILIILLLIGKLSYSQNANNKSLLPEVIPPSPTVANLMKFEEVPVSNYTGIPEVKVPFYSIGLKNINFDINLSYHPLNINANQKASDVGLGWSLMAGGTISRTVRGLPDEMLRLSGGDSEGKVGIYQNSTPNHINNYYTVENMDNSTVNTGSSVYYEFLFDTNVSGKFDTEHDLYQYNFLGYTGRFIIRKENNLLKVVKLDVNSLIIINNHDTNYKPTSFTIIDEFGNQYLFNIEEVSTVVSSVAIDSSKPSFMGGPPTVGNLVPGDSYTYTSSFHLSEIRAPNNNLIANYYYNSNPTKEIESTSNITYNSTTVPNAIPSYVQNTTNFNAYNDFNPLPLRQVSTTQNSTLVKKLERIDIINHAKLFFDFVIGREDSNLHNPQSLASKLNQIIVKNWNGQDIKKYKFNYGYSTVIDKRMILNTIEEYGNSTDYNTYTFDYKQPSGFFDLTLVGKDKWGYFNINTSYSSNYFETSPEICDTDVLTKMTLPSGGGIIFNYESNQYSYIGDEIITNFDDNPDNWLFLETSKTFNTVSNNKVVFFELFDDQNVSLKTETHFNNSGIDEWLFSIYKVDGTNETIVGGASYTLPNNSISLTAGVYKVAFSSLGNIPSNNNYSAKITAYYKKRKLGSVIGYTGDKKYLHGGGIRIKEINYFAAIDEILNNEYAKKVSYNYNLPTDNLHSSGSLTYPVPVYNYTKSKKECIVESSDELIATAGIEFDMSYNVTTKLDNLSIVKTKGSDIGYKFVTVYENNNGKNIFEYTSPIDYPEDLSDLNTLPPFLPTKNIDYKRGLLKKQKTYDNNGNLLKETTNNYDFEEHTITYGMRVFDIGNYSFINYNGFKRFSEYYSFITQHCETTGTNPSNAIIYNNKYAGSTNNCFCYYGFPGEFITKENLQESFGWAKLISSNNKEYFYTNNNVTGFIETNNAYLYNSFNQKIAEQTSTSSYTNETLKTKYFYAHQMSNQAMIDKNMIGIPLKTENYRNSVKLSDQETVYKDWDADPNLESLAPWIIKTSKDMNAAEDRVKYNKYDGFSNPLEVQQENSTKISYIWGYHNTQPVAKLENIAYDAIPSSLITAIQSATDSQTPNETTILNALNALRTSTDVNLQKAMITTYTYKPLVGITSVTDPKADKQTYHYDSFNRLEFVKDKNGNILSENKYHYRTQN